MFQQTVVQKYLKTIDADKVADAWTQYQAHFLNPAIQENIRNSKEEQYQGEFLIDLFVKVLGYIKNPTPGFNLTTELKNVQDSKKADGAIIIDDVVKAVIELKGTKTTDLTKVQQQAFNYKTSHPNCDVVIISNFEKLRLFIRNQTEYQEFNLFTLNKAQFDLLYLLLAHEYFAKDLLIKIKDQSLSQEEEITKKLYKDYSAFKRELFYDLTKRNPNYDPLTLFKSSQKLLDRFLFLFFSEDRGLLPPNAVREILRQWEKLQELDAYDTLINRFRKYFGYLNTGFKGKKYDIFAYNGGLFAPDEILDAVEISDDILYKYTQQLADYDYQSEVDVNILGHIFENSLNEIDEIKAELAGETIDKSKTKRKKDGVFYTPKYITQYIVENTVGKLCEEQKAKLNIKDEDYDPGANYQKKTRAKLEDQLVAYYDWLTQLTICDPACGSGAFLNQALDFLIKEHEYLTQLRQNLYAKDGQIAMAFPFSENDILENNLYGVDINEESVEIAKLSLWLRTAKTNRKLNSLNQNIKVGNSLIDDPEVAGEKAFVWEEEFAHVFEKGGFDVVIGNPPYFNIQTLGAKSIQAEYIQNKYSDIWQDKSDILFYFIYKSLQISKSEVGLIVSNAFLFSAKAKQLRNYLIEDRRISKIVNFEKFLVFEDASITSCITIFNRNSSMLKAIVFKNKKYDTTEISNNLKDENLFFNVKLRRNKVFALVNSHIQNLNEKIDKDKFQLKDLLHLGKGMETAANSVFIFNQYPKHFPESYVKKRMIGENIGRYSLDNNESFLLYFEDIEKFENLPKIIQEYLLENKSVLEKRATVKNEGRNWWKYSRPMHKEYYHYDKIWCSYRNKKNEFMIDMTESYIGLTNTTVIFDTNKEILIKYVLTLINSKLLDFRYKSIGKQTGSGVFEYFANGVGKLPIPKVSVANQQPFIEKADLMLSLNKELQEVTDKFIRTLERRFEIDKLSKKLESWHDLSFAEFVKELKKKKVKLTLAEEAEWEDYFTTEQAKANTLKTQITETDQTIDQMVYDLYGLTEEEIAIVENS